MSLHRSSEALAQLDAPVVDFDRLGGVELVEDQALARPREDHLADLHRRQPVDVEVRQHPVVVVHVDVGDVLDVAVGVGASPRRDAPGLAAKYVVDDRQVVGGEIPDDVDVVLEEPEVDPDAVDVVEVAQLPVFHQLLDPADRVVEQVGMIHHQDPLLAGGQVDQHLGLVYGGRHRFLDENMQARLQTALCQREMRGHRRSNGYRLDGLFQQLLQRT